jgi:hypothetical protein
MQIHVYSIMRTVKSLEPIPLFIWGCAGERANKIFNQLDVNGDGELDEEEFCKV